MTDAVKPSRPPRWLLFTIGLVLLLALLVAGSWFWLMHTTSGARYVLSLARAQGVTTQNVDGSLADGLTIGQLRYSNDSMTLQASSLDATLGIDLLPPAIQIRTLDADQVSLQLKPSESDGGPPPSDLGSPVPIAVDQARIDSFTIEGEDLSETLTDIRFSGHYSGQLVVDQLRLQYQAIDAGVEGEVTLQAPFSHRLDARIDIDEQWPELAGERVTLNLAGNLRETRLDLDAEGPFDLRADGLLRDLLQQPGWNLDVRSPEISWPPADTVITARDLNLHTEGRLDDYALSGSAGLSGPLVTDNVRQDAIGVSLEGHGGPDQLQITRLSANLLDGRIDANGEISWTDGLSAQLSGDLQQLLPTPWLPDWPSSRPISGQFDVAMTPDRIDAEQLLLRWDGGSRIQASATLAGESVDGSLSWQNLQWPIAEASAWKTSHGEAQISGRLSSYQISAGLDISPPDSMFEAVPVDIQATGNMEELRVTSVEATVLGAELEGSGLLTLDMPITWDFEFSGQDFNPEIADPRLPGRIDFQVSTSGQFADGVPQGRLDINELSGELRDQPVSGTGSLVLEDNSLRAEGLDLQAGDNRLTADGGLTPGQGLAADLSITRLEDWVPGARGTLDGRIDIDSNDRYQLSLSGEEVIWNQISLQGVDIQASGQTRDPRSTDLSASAEELIIAGNRISKATLNLEGTEPDFQARLDLTADRAELNTVLSGSVAGLQTNTPVFQGSLQQLQLVHQRLGTWQLDSPSDLMLARQRFELERACLQRSEDQGSLCLDGQLAPDGQASLALEARQVPAQLALIMDQGGLRLGQLIDARLQWQRQTDGDAGQGSATVNLSAGSIELTETDLGPVLTAPSRITADLGPDGLLTGQVDIPLQRGGGLEAEMRIDANDWDRSDQLQGWVRGELDDLTVLERLFPTLDRTAGQARVDLQVSGRVRNPELAGELWLRQADITYLPLGLTVSDLNLDGSLDGPDALRLQADFGAGDGQGTLSGRVSWARSLSADIELSGEQLQVINAPTMKVTASPDLALTWENQQLVVDGRVHIPSASITPRSESAEVITESPDVVLVNAPETLKEQPEATAPFNITGTVEVTLGDDVRFDAGETRATVDGGVTLSWDGRELLPDGEGRLNLSEGRYQAYGQLLELQDSSLRFGGGPVDNPRLRIEAVREIFGDAGVQEAGVRIRGTAERPDIRLFTDPPSNEETALAYVITGSDFDHGSGVGALSVGTYVLPRLYVSYGFGLFEETGNVISARYEFTRNWGVRVVSGDRDTGIDATYTVDRD